MTHRRTAPPTRSLAATLLALPLLLGLAACGGGDEEEEARQAAQPPPPVATLAPLPTNTPDDETRAAMEAAEEAEEEEAEREAQGLDTTFGPATLPADGEAPVLQLARIEHSPWEPEILAQMTPHFSLQSNGFIAFQSPYGESEDGWYQSVITPQETEALLRIFMDQIGVLEMAESRGEPPLTFATGPDGSPEDCPAYGVIYVRSAEREGRLVISECDVEEAEGPEGDRLRKLLETVNLVERWKDSDPTTLSEEQQTAFRSLLGFYSPIRQPYTPDSAVAYGVPALLYTPEDALSAPWPLEIAIEEAGFPDTFGFAPGEILLQAPDSTAMLREGLVFERARPPSLWGPLFTEDGETFYLVGVRASVPGSNQVVVDYEYELPRLDLDQVLDEAPEDQP